MRKFLANLATERTSTWVIAITALLLVAALPAKSDAASTSSVLLFVPGYESTSAHDCNEYDKMVRSFRDRGWNGDIYSVAYYGGDTNCTVDSSTYGSHNGDGSSEEIHSHSRDTSIGHLSYHLAWTIYVKFTMNGISVNAIGYSMGGLIIRDAITKVQHGFGSYPSRIVVHNVVTWGTPHGGVGMAAWCQRAYPSVQCQQMKPDSIFLDFLEKWGWNPQAYGGTNWTAVGSHDDMLVDEARATYMGACHMVHYNNGSDVGHSGANAYYNQTGNNNVSAGWRSCNSGSGNWTTKNRGLPVKLAMKQLVSRQY